MMRAKPTQVTMKRTAPTRPIMRPARMAKMTMLMVMTMKRPRGKPVRAMWEAMKDCRCREHMIYDWTRHHAQFGIPYSKHGPLIRELGYFCKKLITLLRWEDAIDEGLHLVPNATQRALESARQATNSVCHTGCDCCSSFVEGGARLLARDEGKSEQSQESGREGMT